MPRTRFCTEKADCATICPLFHSSRHHQWYALGKLGPIMALGAGETGGALDGERPDDRGTPPPNPLRKRCTRGRRDTYRPSRRTGGVFHLDPDLTAWRHRPRVSIATRQVAGFTAGNRAGSLSSRSEAKPAGCSGFGFYFPPDWLGSRSRAPGAGTGIPGVRWLSPDIKRRPTSPGVSPGSVCCGESRRRAGGLHSRPDPCVPSWPMDSLAARAPRQEVAMCQGGRLLADFVAGTREQPNVPELAGNLAHTVEGEWVVWAYKLARPHSDEFLPLTGRGGPYPADAQAECSVVPERRPVRIPAAAFAPQRGALLESRHKRARPGVLVWLSCPLQPLSFELHGCPFLTPQPGGTLAGLPGRAVVRPGTGLRVAGRSGYGPVPRRSPDSCERGPLARRYTDRGRAVDCGANPGRLDPEPRVVAKGSRRSGRPAGPSPLGAAFRKWSCTAAAPL